MTDRERPARKRGPFQSRGSILRPILHRDHPRLELEGEQPALHGGILAREGFDLFSRDSGKSQHHSTGVVEERTAKQQLSFLVERAIVKDVLAYAWLFAETHSASPVRTRSVKDGEDLPRTLMSAGCRHRDSP